MSEALYLGKIKTQYPPPTPANQLYHLQNRAENKDISDTWKLTGFITSRQKRLTRKRTSVSGNEANVGLFSWELWPSKSLKSYILRDRQKYVPSNSFAIRSRKQGLSKTAWPHVSAVPLTAESPHRALSHQMWSSFSKCNHRHTTKRGGDWAWLVKPLLQLWSVIQCCNTEVPILILWLSLWTIGVAIIGSLFFTF
jgi:hypothetical protein